jgi:predicted alpha/beta-hydrolase family hydrolase
VFLGFPLHPAGRPSDERADHLFQVRIPMLFLQGTRDALANTELLQELTICAFGETISEVGPLLNGKRLVTGA